jgi:hypothetical protein
MGLLSWLLAWVALCAAAVVPGDPTKLVFTDRAAILPDVSPGGGWLFVALLTNKTCEGDMRLLMVVGKDAAGLWLGDFPKSATWHSGEELPLVVFEIGTNSTMTLRQEGECVGDGSKKRQLPTRDPSDRDTRSNITVPENATTTNASTTEGSTTHGATTTATSTTASTSTSTTTTTTTTTSTTTTTAATTETTTESSTTTTPTTTTPEPPPTERPVTNTSLTTAEPTTTPAVVLAEVEVLFVPTVIEGACTKLCVVSSWSADIVSVLVGSGRALVRINSGATPCWNCGASFALDGASWVMPFKEGGVALVFPEEKATAKVEIAYNISLTGDETKASVAAGWSVFEAKAPESVPASLFIATADAPVAENELSLHVAQGYVAAEGQRGVDAKQNAMAGAIVVGTGPASLVMSVHVAASTNVTLRSRWSNYTTWSVASGKQSVAVESKWWHVVRVEGMAEGKAYDLSVAEGSIEIGSTPRFLSVLRGKTATTATPVWLTVENAKDSAQVVDLDVTERTVDEWELSVRVAKEITLPAGAVYLGTMVGRENVTMVREDPDEKVAVKYTTGDVWVDSTMDFGADLKEAHIPLRAVRYNFRIVNSAAEAKTVRISFVFAEAGEGSTDDGELQGMDVLAMFICVIFVFVIFTILASFTMHRMDAAGKLVVSDEGLE